MNLFRASLLFAGLALVAACGAKNDQSASASNIATPVAATAAVAAPSAAQLTEADVRKVVDAAEAASKSMDVDAAIATLSDDVRFTMIPPPASGAQTQSIGREDIIAAFRKQAAETTDRAYSSQVGDIRMAGDGASATANVAVTDQYAVQGHKVVETSDQIYTVANRQGQTKIVAMTSTTTGLTVDGVKRF